MTDINEKIINRLLIDKGLYKEVFAKLNDQNFPLSKEYLLLFIKNPELEEFRELRKLYIKKKTEHKAGRLVFLHELLIERWENCSKQWKVSKLETLVKKGWEFKDIGILLNKHKYFVKERTEARKKKKKTHPKFSTVGFWAINRKMHPKTSPNVKKLIIRDYIKLQEELGLPFVVKKQENTLQRRQHELLENFGIEHFFYMYGSLSLNKELYDLFLRKKVEINEKESNNRVGNDVVEEIERARSAYSKKSISDFMYILDEKEKNTPLEKYDDNRIEMYREEKLIFLSAVKRILENDVLDKDKVINKEKLYSLLLSLYKKFAKDDVWRLTSSDIYSLFPLDLLQETKSESIERSALEFAERLIYGDPSFDPEAPIVSLRGKYSEFLCNVEDYEKGKGKWKSIEHFYKEKYFPTATKY